MAIKFNFHHIFSQHLGTILKSNDVYEILFSLKNLAFHFSMKAGAYRRYAYEALRHHPDHKNKINDYVFHEIDAAVKKIFDEYQHKDFGSKPRNTGNLNIPWEIE